VQVSATVKRIQSLHLSTLTMPQEAIPSHRLVLFLAANPTNTQQLRLDEEVRAIRQQLQRSILTLDACWAVRPLDMQQEILRLKPQIVHFSGHGIGQEPTFTPDKRTLIAVGVNNVSDEEGLVFIEDATGRAALVGTEALASLFKNFQKYVKCVVLNGCYSAVQAEAIAQHIPYVIGMKQAILDRAAIEFSKGFYNALAEGEAIESAFEFGKTAIELTGLPDYQFPVLHKPKETNAHSGLSLVKPDKFRNKRWVMAGCVLASLIGATGVGLAPKFQQSLGLGQYKCFKQAKEEGKLVVAIADFQHDASNQTTASHVAKQLQSKLEKQPRIMPCIINERVGTPREAKHLGNRLDSEIVIWGRQNNPLTLDVKVTTVNVEVSSLTSLPINATGLGDFNKQIEDLPSLVNVMTTYALNYAYKTENIGSERRDAFEEALKYAMARRPDFKNQNNKDVLSKAYFLLGDMYVPTLSDCPTDHESCVKAIRSYQKATDIESKFYEAYINRGLLESSLKNFQGAIQSYTKLINAAQNLDDTLEARKYRASIFLRLEKIKDAITDLRILCKYYPNDPDLLHELGQAQLQAGEFLDARSTYQQISSLKMDKKTVSSIVADLQSLAQLKPELSGDIKLIIKTLGLAH